MTTSDLDVLDIEPNEERATVQRQIDVFESRLSAHLGHEVDPGSLPIDLTDLLGILEQGVQLLNSLIEELPKKAARKAVLQLEILLADDIPMTTEYLLPAIRKVRKELYSPKRKQERKRHGKKRTGK